MKTIINRGAHASVELGRVLSFKSQFQRSLKFQSKEIEHFYEIRQETAENQEL